MYRPPYRATIPGEPPILADYHSLIPRSLSALDKTAFLMHVTEIEKKHAWDDPKGRAMWHILENYGRRTGVNVELLLRMVRGSNWKHHEINLLCKGMI